MQREFEDPLSENCKVTQISQTIEENNEFFTWNS